LSCVPLKEHKIDWMSQPPLQYSLLLDVDNAIIY